MDIEHELRYRRAVCVIARVDTDDPRAIASLAKCFDTTPGTRGALLARGTDDDGEDGATSMHHYPALNAIYGAVTLAGYRRLCKRRHVLEVHRSGSLQFIRPLALSGEVFVPVAPPTGTTWGINWLRIPEMWKWGLTGAGVKIAHIDSGVDPHPALIGAVVGLVTALDRSRVVPGSAPSHYSVHGTHTAATIVGRPVGGALVGVAPGAALLSANVIPGGDTVARFLAGVQWALANHARVINMSVGQDGYNPAFEFVIDQIRSANCLPVCAAGNNSEGSSMSPANYPNALSVGAQDPRGSVGAFSSSEVLKRAADPGVPDLIAPGVDVVSAAPGGGYARSTGTSMAAPHVAGLAALLIHAYPHVTLAQLETAIAQSCRTLPFHIPGRVGRGIPDGVLALKALQAMGAN